MPRTPFHQAIGRDFLEHTQPLLETIRETLTPPFPQALILYLENGVNPSQEYWCSLYASKLKPRGGLVGYDTGDSDWEQVYRITGLEPIQEAFALCMDLCREGDRRDPALRHAQECASLLLEFRFYELGSQVYQLLQAAGDPLARIPFYGNLHDGPHFSLTSCLGVSAKLPGRGI